MRRILKAHEPNIPLWFIPMLYVGVTIVCGLTLPRLEQEYLAAYSHGMSVASAQATLSAIASGMMALTGIFFYAIATLAWIDRWGNGTVPLFSTLRT